MRRFRYAADPLCAISCFLYLLNRLILVRHFHSAFLHGHFNDLLLIPCALPLVLWLQRRLGLRIEDSMPNAREIGLHVGIWALISEGVVPLISSRATGDPIDVLCYLIGAAASAWWWQSIRRTAPDSSFPGPPLLPSSPR